MTTDKTKRLRVGLLGCGAISPSYFKNVTGDLSSLLEMRTCADIDLDLARSRAEEFNVSKVASVEELLADAEIDIVVNLTPAPVHFETSMQILQAGKHLFSEKPLSLSLKEGRQLLDAAEQNSVQIAGAADTFLGGSLQACLKLLEAEVIGQPIAAQAHVALNVFASERYHRVYSGALFDMGPYYLTALVATLGSVTRVSGFADIRFPSKVDGESGQSFELLRASTSVATLSFESGAVATVLASEDVHSYFPGVEIFGREGRLKLSDANMYGAAYELETHSETRKVNPSSKQGYVSSGRGLGLAELALAIREGRQARSSGALMYHVLETMQAVYESSRSGKHIEVESRAPAMELLSERELSCILGKTEDLAHG